MDILFNFASLGVSIAIIVLCILLLFADQDVDNVRFKRYTWVVFAVTILVGMKDVYKLFGTKVKRDATLNRVMEAPERLARAEAALTSAAMEPLSSTRTGSYFF